MRNNIIPILGESTLIVTPGRRTGFAISHSNRSVTDVFQLSPTNQSPEGMLAMLLSVLGSRAEMIRYVLVIDTPALPGDGAVRVADARTAAVALAAGCGAELRSLGYQCLKAVADEYDVTLNDSTGLAATVEKHRRVLASQGEKLGELLHPVDPAKQADHSDLRALSRHVQEAVAS
ncbi:hypothetical protein FNL56_21535 [Tardiphaga sp. vice304]|uniref:hypothetical protein n=1 Tax=Tardiphaga sp. vice304 TaxID=2592817 RepID=UPI0011637314|nr:hypothetical protein [Tardiphaga sp. vice304]QDM28406.1 hypothetical protein FNL56_21535 [Tardiphaga sp. vice304]